MSDLIEPPPIVKASHAFSSNEVSVIAVSHSKSSQSSVDSSLGFSTKNRKRHYPIIILISCMTLLSFGSLFLAWHFSQLSAVTVAERESESATYELEIAELKQRVSDLEAVIQTKDEFISARNGFIDSVDAFNVAIAEAGAVFPVSQWSQRVQESIEVVYSETENVTVLTDETAKVEGFIVEIYAALDTYDKQATGENQAINSGEGTTPRRALDKIANDSITMSVVDKACNVPKAMACVTSSAPNHIQVSDKYLHYSDAIWYMVMMHEYAHTVQFNNYAAFKGSLTVEALFAGNAELHADCMAEALIGDTYVSSYGSVCSVEQLAAGKAAWDGIF